MSKRTTRVFQLEETTIFQKKLLCWAQQFETIAWLDSNNYQQKYSSFNCALAIEEFTAIKTDYHNAFEKLTEYQATTNDYIFGYISYDVKNDTENLQSANYDGLEFPDLYFFQPQKLIFIKKNTVEFHYLKAIDDELEDDFETIIETNHKQISSNSQKKAIKIKLRTSKEAYYKKVGSLINHIQKGNVYEANFCQEFYAEDTSINPYKVYQDLNAISIPPFATFFKNNEQYILSASPERYIKKEGKTIISQPIKGTAKRLINPIEDKKIAFDLARDSKERSENIMIVDLVRNDLSKTAIKGSVTVSELCKVYSFKQVHQLISTIKAEVSENTNPVSILKNTYPMGSMTGAPKVAAMELIEELEDSKRGIYSGTVGYFTPNGNFDFNVIIRSILYNATKKYVSYSVGGAITAKSTPEKEYQECLLKAKAMKYVLTNK